MEDNRYRYPIELEVITPLSVGAGNDNEWVKGIDFVQKNDKVYVIDMQKVASHGVNVAALTSLFLKSDNDGICRLLGSQMGEMSKYIFDAPVRTNNNIKTFLRTQFYDKPLVAGSSIKGSIRSALFNYLRTNEEKNEEVFGNMKEGTDFMRFIRIGDVEMGSTVLVNTKLFNLRNEGRGWFGGWKHKMSETTGKYNPVGFNTFYECVAPGEKGLGNISLATNAFDLLEKPVRNQLTYANKKRDILNKPICHLFQIINAVTKGYLLKEQAFFEKYDAERSKEVLDCIKELLSMIPDDGSCCLLKMSAGVGYHSITGDWRYNDYDNTGVWEDSCRRGKKKYKSRKIAEYNHCLQLMGFVLLRALNNEQADDRKQALQIQHQNHQDQMLDAIRQQEAELQQKEGAERARKEAAEQEKQKTEEYDRLILQVKQDKDTKRWNEAIAHLQKAAELYPGKAEVEQLKAEIQRAKETSEYLHQIEIDTLQRFKQPLSEVIKDLTSAGNLIGTTVKWLKFEDHTFGQAEQTAFIDEVQKLDAKEKKKLKGRLSELGKAVGKECLDQLIKGLAIG